MHFGSLLAEYHFLVLGGTELSCTEEETFQRTNLSGNPVEYSVTVRTIFAHNIIPSVFVIQFSFCLYKRHCEPEEQSSFFFFFRSCRLLNQ
jgi:hypothetical protein